jgi:hypothetical protein
VAYVFTRGNEGWPVTPSAILHDPGNSRKDDFAATVAISGNAVVVGADGLDSKGAGVAYVFTKGNAGYWPAIPTSAVTDPQATRGDDFGVSVGISGTTAIIGAEWANLNLKNGLQAGAAYLYQA